MQSKTLNPTDNLTPYKVVDGREVILLGNNDFLNNPNNQELIDQKINGEFEGETTFPLFDKRVWKETSRIFHPIDSKHAHSFDFVIYEKE